MTSTLRMTTTSITPAVRPRPSHIGRAVYEAVLHWRLYLEPQAASAHSRLNYPPLKSVLQPIERREPLIRFDESFDAVLPTYAALPHKGNFWHSLGRLLAWSRFIA